LIPLFLFFHTFLLFTNEDFNIRLPAAGRDLGFRGDLFDSGYGGLGLVNQIPLEKGLA
jgi:hypothetical protein